MNINELVYLDEKTITLELKEQRDLYSEEEIEMLEERLRFLNTKPSQEKNKEWISNKKKEFRDNLRKDIPNIKCPKCDGLNPSHVDVCGFCGYEFEDQDYKDEDLDDEIEESNIGLYIVALLIPFVGIIIGIICIAKDKSDLGVKLIIFSVVVWVIAAAIIMATMS